MDSRAARTPLQDVLSYDPTCPASFPNDGRSLTADTFVVVLTNRKVTEDDIWPRGDLLSEFP